MINEIKERLESAVNEAASHFTKVGYEVNGEVAVSDIEDGFNTYVFPALHITCLEDSELCVSFGFTVEIDSNGKYNTEEMENDIAEFIGKAKQYADKLDTAENKCEALRTLDAEISEEVANSIKEEAERTAARETAAIKATYRQMFIAGGVMVAVAVIFFIISKLF